MSTQDTDRTVERFIAGEDRLAALLRALPAYEPPAAMASRFSGLARVAQKAYAPPVSATPVMPMVFEAPASLEAGFIAEAARIQVAQQPRHDAVIAQIQAGKSANEVLGHEVTTGTAQWLANKSPPPAKAAVKSAARHTSGWARWRPRLGVLAASILFGSVATNLWLAQRADRAALPASALNESRDGSAPATASDAKALPPTVALQVEPIAQISAVSKSRNVPGAGETKQRVEQRLREQAAEAERIAKIEGDVAENSAADKATRERVAEPPPPQERQLDEPRFETLARAKAAPTNESRTSAAEPPPPAAAGAAPPATRLALRAAPAPMPVLRVALSSAPQDAAKDWAANAHAHPPRVFAASPDAERVRAWVEHFRQALPPDQRPAQIHIEQDVRLRDDNMRIE